MGDGVIRPIQMTSLPSVNCGEGLQSKQAWLPELHSMESATKSWLLPLLLRESLLLGSSSLQEGNAPEVLLFHNPLKGSFETDISLSLSPK